MRERLTRFGYSAEMQRALSSLVVFITVVTIALLLARFAWRGWIYPKPRKLPEELSEDLDAALTHFEAVVSQRAPTVMTSLNPGLNEAEISAIEKNYRLRLTDDLRCLYRWRNGTCQGAISDLIPGHRFLPLEEAAEVRNGLQREASEAPFVQWAAFAIFAGHRKNWLTILDDHCGDGYFYDPARRRQWGSFFYHFAETADYRFFPTLANFIVGAAQCYESGVYTVRMDGRMDEKHEKSIELWPRYAAFNNFA